MLGLHKATVTGDQLLMNTIHFEQEMETGLELFASFALRSILSALTHHNQHLNEIECYPEHTVPKDSLNCAVGSERHAESGEHVISTTGSIRVYSRFCFEIASVTPLPRCDKSNESSQHLKLSGFIH